MLYSFSAISSPTCSKNGTRVIYTNGVTTKRDNAQDALDKIIALALNSQIDLKPTTVKYRLAYNYEESVAKDFLEAAVQRFPAGFLKSLGVTNGYAAYMGYLSGGLSDAIYAVALNSITDKLLEIQSDWLINYRSGSLYLQTIREIKGHYETAFNSGERVFAISHSQGGLFMSDAFDQTSFADKQKYFSGFQIASPLSSEMNSHFGYATHDKDNLINFVRTTVGALPANVTAPFFLSNGYTGLKDYIIDYHLNHGVVTTYLYDSTIRSQLISKLVEAAQLLESNCPKAVINYTKNNLVVNFDSTDPENPNATNLSYAWYFGADQPVNTNSKTVSHTYAQPGTYKVDLTVFDEYGQSSTTSVTVNVTAPEISFFVKINPAGTYLRTDTKDLDYDTANYPPLWYRYPQSASFLDLTSLYNNPEVNLRPGDLILLQATGDFQFGPAQFATDTAKGIAGVFVGSSGFLYPGSLSDNLPTITSPTYGDGIPTDIPQDFSIPYGYYGKFQVPNGATKILFTAADSNFGNNYDPDKDFGVWIKITIVRAYQSPLN